MKNSEATPKTSNTTTGQATPSKAKRSYRLTPKQRAKADAAADQLSLAMRKGLAKDNEEIFGTPIPDELKD